MTIRLLHLADTHLGVENYGRLDPSTGLSSRLGDFLAVLDEAVEYAIGQQVDLVVFAGDAYKSRDPNPTHQREFARRIYRLSAAGIPCFLLVGNHDVPNAQNRAHTTEIFDTLAVPGVTVARKPGTTRIATRSGPLQIIALPWVTRSGILTREEHKNHTLPELDALLLEKLESVIKAEIDALDPTLPAILVGHCTVMGATYGSEKSVMLGQDLVIPKTLLAHPALAYVALGHLHRHQVVHDSPPIVYAGSLERIDFGEEREEKGFVVVELDTPAPIPRSTFQVPGSRFHFIPVRARRFLTIEVQAAEGDPTEATLAAIARHDVGDAVVRVVVHTATDVRLRESEVRQALKDAYFIAAIAQEVEHRARRRLGAAGVEGMTPREALAAYLQAKGASVERQQVLLAYAERLIAAE